MFKTLVLSALYNLSDDQIEYQVRYGQKLVMPDQAAV
jgi:hypothetical protein